MKSFHDTTGELVERRFPKVEDRVKAASAIISRMCSGDKGWQMCVPPQGDDADILLLYVVDEYERLYKLVNSPEILDFIKAVQLEAVFQREKWGTESDAGKTDTDWFWLIGYLAGKALHNPNTTEANADKKRLHRIITIAAAACNWHAAVLGNTDMRPGIEPPAEVKASVA